MSNNYNNQNTQKPGQQQGGVQKDRQNQIPNRETDRTQQGGLKKDQDKFTK